MSENQRYKFADTMEQFDAGVFEQKVSQAIRDAALGVATHGEKGKKGKVTLEFTMSRIAETDQIMIEHKIVQSIPTARGKKGEENLTSTPVYVAGDGALSIMPARQTGFEFDKS